MTDPSYLDRVAAIEAALTELAEELPALLREVEARLWDEDNEVVWDLNFADGDPTGTVGPGEE